MHLKLKPLQIPFKVGDEVFINIPYHTLNQSEATSAKPETSFQAVIMRIFLEGLRNLSVINERKDEHELVISHLIYDLKPIGMHKGLNRVPLTIDVSIDSNKEVIFRSYEDLVAYGG